jgi:hypothetical protein
MTAKEQRMRRHSDQMIAMSNTEAIAAVTEALDVDDDDASVTPTMHRRRLVANDRASEIAKGLDACERAHGATLDALVALVRYVRRVGGFMEASDQETLWNAEAVLKQHGREVR